MTKPKMKPWTVLVATILRRWYPPPKQASTVRGFLFACH